MSTLSFLDKDLPALRVLARTTVVAATAEVGAVLGPMFEGLAHELAAAGDPPAHPGVAWYLTEAEGLRLGAGYLGSSQVPPGAAFHDLPAAPMAVTATYVGTMSGIGQAWQELTAHVHGRGLRFDGPCREIYHEVRGAQEGWITELQAPVCGAGE